MNIKKAVEIQRLNLKFGDKTMPQDVKTALIMSTSALVQVQLWREHGYPEFMPLLDGETEQ